MGANLLLKRIMLVVLVSAFPIFASVASPGGGGHSSGGSGGGFASSSSGGGHSSSGSSGGHSANASSNSATSHSSTGSSNGHFASGSNNAHSSNAPKGSPNAPKGNHPGDPASPAVVAGHPITGSPDRSSLFRAKPVQAVNKQHFGSGYGHNDLAGDDDSWKKRPHYLHHLFGFIPYWSTH
jgi:hypothetical protein